jgi:peptidoglycan/xylan/chitin deacetylase (PgdA/CDA1 family)
MEPTISAFDQQISLLKKFFSFYTLEKAIDLLATNSLPTNAAVITFDDGYRDNFTNALPILLKHGLPATFFVTTEFIGGGCMWNDRVIHTLVDSKEEALILPHLSEGIVLLGDTENRKRLALNLLSKIKHLDYQHREDAVAEIIQIAGGTVPSDIMMSIDEVIALRDAGMEIGGHTNTHPILTKLSEASSLNEMAIGKEILEGWLKEPVRTFAYPNGKPKIDYSNCHVQAAKTLGFKGAVSTAWGVSTYSSDIFQLPRFRPWDTHQWKFLARLLLNYKNTKPTIC